MSGGIAAGGLGLDSSGGPNTIESLARQLQDFQQNIATFAQRLAEYKRKKGGISSAEKKDCEAQLAEFRRHESKISASYTSQREQLTKSSSMFSVSSISGSSSSGSGSKSSAGSASNAASAQTAELATRRLALSKIGNDINRVTAMLQQCDNDVSMLTVTSYSSSGGSSSGSGARSGGQQQQQQQQLQFQALQGQDVDDMILEERERDINQINKDVQLVNEMFKDMANIVQSQQPMVEEIHKTTEEAAAHAKEGLNQVNEAAAYQPTCSVM